MNDIRLIWLPMAVVNSCIRVSIVCDYQFMSPQLNSLSYALNNMPNEQMRNPAEEGMGKQSVASSLTAAKSAKYENKISRLLFLWQPTCSFYESFAISYEIFSLCSTIQVTLCVVSFLFLCEFCGHAYIILLETMWQNSIMKLLHLNLPTLNLFANFLLIFDYLIFYRSKIDAWDKDIKVQAIEYWLILSTVFRLQFIDFLWGE